jgi:hypothetical protein
MPDPSFVLESICADHLAEAMAGAVVCSF